MIKESVHDGKETDTSIYLFHPEAEDCFFVFSIRHECECNLVTQLLLMDNILHNNNNNNRGLIQFWFVLP